eukprot:TRINITY_DN22726_c0_g1_i1.p1 TRINITY_DN22726_c0_g1~~TRINITY_DN22726_c0_g1_i1.p1  ORF type:complete len:469 (+),score=148.68 TRINITY_DN22726_c0_g1_i1:59-1465(+)
MATSGLRPLSSLPGLGKSWLLFNATSSSKMMEAGVRHDRLMSMYLGQAQTVVATHPDTARAVLTRPQDFIKMSNPDPNRKKLQDPVYCKAGTTTTAHLVGVNGKEWTELRKVMNPAFAREALDRLVPLFEEQSDKVIARWAGRDSMDVKADMQHFALDVLGSAVFGCEFNALDGDFDETYAAYKRVLGSSHEPLYLLFPKLESLPLKRNKELKKAVDHMVAFFESVITGRRAERAAGIVRERRDILDMILPDEEGNGGIPEEALIPNMWIFLLAGHDTTAISLSWILLELARHPEVQQKARAEAAAILAAKPAGEGVTSEDLEKLPYISAVINESLRLHPPVFNVPTRMAVADTELDGYAVPKKTIVSLHIGAINRHPSVWDRPDEFDPSRFLGEKQPRVFHHLPFSAGPRRCIGDRFSLVEQKTLLLKLLPRMELVADAAEPVALGTDSLPLVFKQPKEVVLQLRHL